MKNLIRKQEKIEEDSKGISIQYDATTGLLGIAGNDPTKFDED